MSLRVNAQKSCREGPNQEKWGEISARLTSIPPDTGLRLLILAAHPDDETIGASRLLSRDHQSRVAFLTDGAPRDRSLWSQAAQGSREDYASIRRLEAAKALSFAGVPETRLHWLGGIDQDAALELGKLARSFGHLLSRFGPDVVVTHSYEGGHPDHDSAALVANVAISLLQPGQRPLLVEMTSYHAKDGRCVTGEFLSPNTTPELSFELDDSDRERKRRMMEAYSSQRLVLENFPIDKERLRAAPDYDFSQPPHAGKLWYECMGWSMTGERWRKLAMTALAEFQELQCH
jgi:LmbE family N-acetylglucosaminyl deacetylase